MKTIMLLGSGELGRELTISLKRLGCFVVACDSYDRAPAMQVADHSITFDMLNADELNYHISVCKPDLIVPEIEAINTEALEKYSNVVPSSRAVSLTMNRDKIRDRADELGLPVLKYAYAQGSEELLSLYLKDFEAKAVVIKPVMSSSGKGQTVLDANEGYKVSQAWDYAIDNMRGSTPKVIIEEFYDFDYEITILTTRTKRYGTLFSPAIVHRQRDGDFYISIQDATVPAQVEVKAREIASKITEDLQGYGLFGVELFVKGNDVVFSEVSPRPHDTGLVTLFTQNLSQFDLHARAILNLPIPSIEHKESGVCMTINGSFDGRYSYDYSDALNIAGINVHMFNKRHSYDGRRLGLVFGPNEQTTTQALSRIKIEQRKATNLTDFAT